MTRRQVFKSLLGLLAAPLAVTAARLMPKPVPLSPKPPSGPHISIRSFACVNGKMHETVWHVYAPPGVVLDVMTTGITEV